jgi:transposase
MPRKAQLIKLTDDELRSLTMLLRKGTIATRKHTRARVLQLLDQEKHPSIIAETLSISRQTVFKLKRRYQDEGLQAALSEHPRSGKPVRIDGIGRAKLTALACSDAPSGYARWTLRLLADKAVELGFVEAISHNHVRQILKKTNFDRT